MWTWRRQRWVIFPVLLMVATIGHQSPARASPPKQDVVANMSGAVEPLAADTAWDYQIGGIRRLAARVGVVVRDRRDPMAGVYDVCYVNAFQTQTAERMFWRHQSRRDLILRSAGEPVVDGAWGELLLDTRTRSERLRLAAIVDNWLAGCEQAGAEAVELDNLDSWTRSKHLLTRADNIRYVSLLITAAHTRGLAVAQKNTPQIDDGKAIGFDFAIAEDCARWRECQRYTAEYGSRVLAVEYDRRSFERGCSRWGELLPMILRDVEVTPGGPRARC